MNNEKKDSPPENGTEEAGAKDESSKNNPDEVMELKDIEKSFLENKVKEVHNNIRHITQLAMNWFIFFVTVNYATMGWLAAGSDISNKGTVAVIALAFIAQNGVGIYALYMTGKVVMEMNNGVECYETFPISNNKLCIKIQIVKSVPIELLMILKRCMTFVLVVLILAWIIYAGIRICNVQIFSKVNCRPTTHQGESHLVIHTPLTFNPV
jgi:hypothetical protein